MRESGNGKFDEQILWHTRQRLGHIHL